MGPIPWTAIERWTEVHDVVGRERFHVLVRRMDDALLSRATEKAGG